MTMMPAHAAPARMSAQPGPITWNGTFGTRKDAHPGCKKAAPILNNMEYRGIEYSVLQGLGRHVWKWSVSLDTGVSVGGRTATKSEAVAEAERTIDRALAPKKLRLVQPKTER